MSEAARTRRPDLRFEPQMDRAGAGAPGADPLAELARLVGQDDPFRDVFKTGGRSIAARAPGKTEPTMRNDPPARSEARGYEDPRMRGSIDDDHVETDADRIARNEGYESADHRWDEADQPPDYDAQDYETAEHHGTHEAAHYHTDGDPETAHQDYEAPPLTPDLWAQGAEHEDGSAPNVLADDGAPRSRAPRRPLAVLAAVLLLTGGGLAATFVARSGPGAAVLGRNTPTIMAAAGPNKIKQDETPASTTPEDVDSALLNRNNPTSSGPTRVVSSQEQPVDLAQLPRAAGSSDAQGEAQPAASGNMFPEPKKVKTFVVRPDGTILSSGSAPPQTTASIDNLPALASLPPAAEASAAAPRPTTPKASARAATTPRSAPTTIADVAAGGTDLQDTAQRGRQPSSSGVKPPRAKPVEVADASASVTPAATGQGGTYGLQLAAAPTEQEARDLFAKLQKKYSAELGPYRPTIRKADSGDKSVYRLRVSNLSQDQAKQICSQLQASGGSCFVVRN